MKTKEFVRAIKKIIKEEVAKQVKVVLAEQKAATTTPSITEEYKTIGTFSAANARAGFAAMNGANPLSTPDNNGRTIDPANVPESMQKALTRDYSELVKRFK